MSQGQPLYGSRKRSKPPRSRFARFFNVGSMLARVFLGYKWIALIETRRGPAWAEARRKRHHRWSAERFYDTAIRNQGLLIKTAQFLSSRPDVVPDEYVDVLSRLQDEVPPEPFAVIRRVIESELGGDLFTIFREFEAAPVASASLAQVHRAVLSDGRVAAVKVQYPGIERIVAIDLKNIARFTDILRRLDSGLDFRFVAEEMGRMIPLELEFINEGRNAEAIAANFADVDDIVVPKIFREHTTKRVLTMEFVQGVKISDVEGIRAAGLDPADVAKVLVVAFSEMILRHGLFHADPHPGNLLVAAHPTSVPSSPPMGPGVRARPTPVPSPPPLGEGDKACPEVLEGVRGPDARPVLVLVDFGQVKEVGPEFRYLFGQMTKGLMAADDSVVGRSFRDMGFRMRQDTAEGYERLGNAYVGRIAQRMAAAGAAYADRDMFRDSYREMSRLLRANPLVKIPADLLFVGRVIGLLNGLSMTLGARTNLLLEMARLLERDAAGPAATAPANGARRRLLEA